MADIAGCQKGDHIYKTNVMITELFKSKLQFIQMLLQELTKDLINGCIRWQSTIEDAELSLEALWDVVPASSRLDHGSHELDVCNDGKVSWFL